MTVSTRTLDTIAQLVEGSEPIRLANQLGQQRDDWRARAERAEALIKDLVGDAAAGYEDGMCFFCGGWIGKDECHADTCPIARARALLEDVHV